MQDSLRIGEYSGSQGEFTLKDGAMHCFMDVFVGAATAFRIAPQKPRCKFKAEVFWAGP